MKPTPKAMTPSAAYPYFDEKPMQFRGVKVRASPKVRLPCCGPQRHASRSAGLASCGSYISAASLSLA